MMTQDERDEAQRMADENWKKEAESAQTHREWMRGQVALEMAVRERTCRALEEIASQMTASFRVSK